MKRALVALTIVLLATAAHAQGMRGGGGKGHGRQQQTAQPEKKKVDENAYKDALSRIPDQKPADPWRNAR